MLNTQRQQFRIRRLELRNIRCFETLDIDFCGTQSEEPAPWAIILGDNGSGKSTVLTCLALVLSSPQDTFGLFAADAETRWLRTGTERGSISLEYDTGFGSSPRRRELGIVREGYGEKIAGDSQANDLDNGDGTPFLCGYGATRRTFGTSSSRGYSSRNAVATLFDAEAPLQNPELAFRRVMNETTAADGLLHIIDRLLTLPNGSTRLGKDGLQVQGPWGASLPVTELSDGYQATLAWIMDMIGWALQKSGGTPGPALEGTILIDEIEQHLHPSWQRHIIGRLREQFPGLNVILTTHAPLCVVGTTDLDDAVVNLVHLAWDGDVVVARGNLKPPRGQRADQILTSYLFGLRTTSDDRTRNRIQRLSELLSKGDKLSAEELQERVCLQAELDNILGQRETELETETAEQIQTVLMETVTARLKKRLAADKIVDGVETVADYEVRRQLRDLFERGSS